VWGRALSPVALLGGAKLRTDDCTSAHFHDDFHLYSHMIMCDTLHMPTNLALDDRLIEEARRAGKHKTKKEAVNAALDEYVRKRKQTKILEAFGTVSFDPAYDYKAERRRARRASGKSLP
jgi:Arc/MetJ family transcription regulator